MSQFTTSISAPSQSNLESKDIAANPSLHPTPQVSKHQQPESSTTGIVPFGSRNEQLYSLANVSETLRSMPARMTRKRTADLAYIVEEQDQTCKAEAFSKPEDHPQPSIETIDKICLCQPDPKIPRPRNAFILYRQQHQQSIVAHHRRLPNPEISKIAGELWRAEPDHVKNEWKLLADEEKSRHAQQYPDYRFQPRHKRKSVPASVASERTRCNKCGGHSIIATGPPFQIRRPSSQSTSKAIKQENQPPTPPASNKKMSGTFSQRAHGLTIDPNRSGPRYHYPVNSPVVRWFTDDATGDSQDSKRARYEGWNSTLPSRSDPTRLSNAGLPPLPQRHSPPSINQQQRQGQQSENPKHSTSPPITAQLPPTDPRRNSLQLPRPQPQPQPTSAPYYGHRLHSPSRTLNTPALSASLMRPPPPRFPPNSASLNGYPLTPTTARLMHDPSDPSYGRRMSELMHIPSLLTPGAPDENRVVEAMVMSIPFFNKLKVIRQVARRIDESYLSTPGSHMRGSILAIEGDDPRAVDGVIASLSDILQRSGEFDVRTMSGPASPQEECDFKDYMFEILQWHEKSKHMIDFITGTEHARQSTPTQLIVKQEPVSMDEEMDVYSSSSEGEILESARKDSHDSHRESLRTASVGERRQTSPTTSTRTSPLSDATRSPKIPLLLISNHILHATNVWSSSIPITDSYSPVDQWRWFASLWRGIVGADVTIYIRALAGIEPEEKKKALAKTPTVKIEEDVGTIVLRQDGEKVEDSAVRRVAFEVGEWVRRIAAGAGEGKSA